MTTQRCANCKFVFEYNDGRLHCHKYAPRPEHNLNDFFRASWPVVSGSDWCGEWQDANKPIFDADDSILQKPIEEIEWPVERKGWKTNNRIIKLLTENHIRTLGDLVRTSETELMQMYFMGRVSVANIKTVLATMGLKLNAFKRGGDGATI